MFVKLEGKRCLVVGAGKVGEPKIGALIDTGAHIRVIAVDASETVHEWANAGKITLEVRAFAAEAEIEACRKREAESLHHDAGEAADLAGGRGLSRGPRT